ncbi:unnamed protein product, partial [Ceratitis capitata]
AVTSWRASVLTVCTVAFAASEVMTLSKPKTMLTQLILNILISNGLYNFSTKEKNLCD